MNKHTALQEKKYHSDSLRLVLEFFGGFPQVHEFFDLRGDGVGGLTHSRYLPFFVSKFCFACLFTVIIIQHLLNVVDRKINVLLNFFLLFHNIIQRLLLSQQI